MVVSSDEVRAAIDKAAKKIAEERAKKAKQAQQNQQGQQATQQTQQTQTTQQTQGEKDLNTIKIPDALKGSATLKDINSRYKYTTPEGKTVMQTEGQQLQEAIDKKQRQTGWEKFKKTGKDLITGVKEIGKSLWSEYVSNTDKEKGILDYDKYQMYQDEMLADSTTQEQRNKIMDKMESEGVIDRDTYNSWVQNQVKAQEKDVDYEINKVKEEQKNDFREQLKQVVQPYVEQADNHYQIDAYTNAIDRLMKQYEMLYDNVVETYDDTRNTRILGARDQYGYKLQDDIKTFLGDWSKHISEGMTDNEAYKETIKNNQEVANRIVDYERAITDMQYQVTIHDNFSKEGNVGGTILSQATNAILGVSNLITLGITNYVTNPLEEAKQLTGYYDIVEELANLNIKDEADGWLKRGYKSVGSFIRSLYDAAPTLIPSIGSLFLAGKISKAAEGVEKVKEAAVGAKGLSGIVKGGLKGVELFGVELTNDMILLDTTFQTALGRPITREDAVWNMIPNFILDAVSAKAMSRPVKEYLTNIPRGEIMKNVVKKELVDKLSGMKDYGKMVDYFYHYKSLEIANGLEDTGKTIDLNDLAKTDPDLAGKVKAVQIGAAEFPDKVISGNITEKQLFQLVLEKLHKERQSALLQKVANEMSDAPKTTTKVGKTTTKKAATQAQNITKEVDDIMDESDLLSTVMKNNKISTEIKFISSTVKGLVASGLVDAKTVASMVKTASNGNQGVYDFMMGVLVSGEQGKTYLKRGIAYFDNVQKELGNSLLYTQSQLQEGYDNLFAQIIKKYDSVLQEGQQIGMYMKTVQGYKNLMTGEIKSLEEIVKQYGSSGLENLGNKTIADFKQFKNDINTDINIVRNADEGNRRISYKTRNKEGHVVEEYQDTVTGLVRRRDFYNGKDSILLNHYFTNSIGTGSDGLPIDIIGGLSAEVINREGLGNILRDVFDSVGFDFALKQNKEGVRHMYIWSRSIENLEDFSNVLSDIATKNSVTEMSNIELNAFKVSHLNEFVESLYQYKKAGKNINNFKPWYENLYTKAGNKYILNKYGNVKQIQRLTDAMKNNVSWKELENIAAENSISSNVKNISDGMKEGNEGELNFTYNERQIKNRILQSKKLQDPLTRRDEIKAILKKEFSQYYSNEKMYEKIMNKLTDFIISFHDKKTGITEGMVEQLGKLYSSIITDPNTLEFINRIDTKENNFFNVLTAKLINQGHERSEFNQAFANYIIAISDELYERTGEKITKISQLIPKKALKDDSPYYNAISGIDQLLQKVEKLKTSKYFSGDARYGLMKSIDSKEISNVVEMLGLVNKEQRDLFFSQGINGKDINIKDKWTKNRTRIRVRDIPKDELQSLINTITFDELKNAGIFDYNFLTQMREGLVDMLTRSTSIDGNIQIQLKTFGDGRISMIPIFNSKTEGNVVNLGSIDLDRLRLRGSSGTEAFKEAITHELSHVDKIMKYMQGIDEYVKDVEKRVQGLNTSDRKELLASMHYLMFGDESIEKIYSTIDEKYKDIDMIAQNIWNRFGNNPEGASSLDRFRVAKEVFNDIIRPLEEIITEAYTINAVFGGCPELPKEFNTVLKAIEEKYRLVNTVLNTLEGNGFKDLDEFKSVLYNKQVTTSYDNIFDSVYLAKASTIKENEEELNFIADYVINGKQFQKDINIYEPIVDYDARAQREIKEDIEDMEVRIVDEIDDLKRAVGLSTKDTVKPEELNGNSFLEKIMHDTEELGEYKDDRTMGRFIEKQTNNKNQLKKEAIFKYSTVGEKTINSFQGGSFIDQINKAYVGYNRDPRLVGTDKDELFRSQKKFFELINEQWKNKKMKKFKDIPLGQIFYPGNSNVNNSVLPLIDEKVGDKIAIKLNDIINNTSNGKYVRIDADDLLIGEDLMDSYYDYLKREIGGEDLIEYIGVIEIDGKIYKGFDDFALKTAENKIVSDELIEKWNNAVAKKINDENVGGIIGKAQDVMPLQSYIISRHVIQILSAIGQYSGQGSKMISDINDGLVGTILDKLYTELASKNNYKPFEEILNRVEDKGLIDELDIKNILTVLGKNNSTQAKKDLLLFANRISQEKINSIFESGKYGNTKELVNRRFDDYLRDLFLDDGVVQEFKRGDMSHAEFLFEDLIRKGMLSYNEYKDIREALKSYEIKEYIVQETGYLGDDVLKENKGIGGLSAVNLYIEDEFDKLIKDLGISTKADIEQTNQSIGNFVKASYGGGNVDTAFNNTVNSLYERILVTSANIRYMNKHNGELPDLKRKIFPADVYDDGELVFSQYSENMDKLGEALEMFKQSYIDRWFIHDAPELGFKETRPYNITANIGIEIGKYIDSSYLNNQKYINTLKDTVKNIEFDGGSKYIAKKNVAQTIDGIPTSNHFDYLQAYGLQHMKDKGKVGNVWIELDSISKTDNNVGTYVTRNGDVQLKWNDSPRRYNLSTNRVISENGETFEDFTTYGLLRQLLVNYENKKNIGVIAEFTKDKFQKQPNTALKQEKGGIKTKTINREGIDMIQFDGLRLSYNNVFGSFVGREICRRLGIEKQFLRSGQTNQEVIYMIRDRIAVMIDKAKRELNFAEGGEYEEINRRLKSLRNLNSRLDKIVSKREPNVYNGGMVNTIKNKSLDKIYIKEGILDDEITPIEQIDAYIPTFTISKVEGRIDDGGMGEEVIVAKKSKEGGSENDHRIAGEGDFEMDTSIIHGDRWISNEAAFDTYYDDLFMSHLGESIEIAEEKSGPTMIRYIDKNGNYNYGVVNIGLSEWEFIPLDDSINYWSKFKEGIITEAEFEKISLLSELKNEINKGQGIATKYSIIGPEKPEWAKKEVDKLNGVTKTIKNLSLQRIDAVNKLNEYYNKIPLSDNIVLSIDKNMDDIINIESKLDEIEKGNIEFSSTEYRYGIGYVEVKGSAEKNLEKYKEGLTTKLEELYKERKELFNRRNQLKTEEDLKTLKDEFVGEDISIAKESEWYNLRKDVLDIDKQLSEAEQKRRDILYKLKLGNEEEGELGFVSDYNPYSRSSKIVFNKSIKKNGSTIEATVENSSGDYGYGPDVATLVIKKDNKIIYKEQLIDEDFDEKYIMDLLNSGKEGKLGFAKSIDESEEDRIIDEALGDMGQVSEEEIKQRGWDITYGDDIIKKDISEAEKEVNKANTFKGVVSPDGETFLPGTKEAEKALDNGGTDVFLMQKAAEYMDYITPQQLNRISSNLFSLSNYDIIESSDILNGIAGHRTHFMDNNKDALQEAIHNFNNLISDYSQADKEKLYKDIINQARLILKQRNNNLHVNSDGNMVTGMTAEQFSKMKCTINISDASKEVNQALRDIGNVFVHTDTASDINPSWSWALQFATLNEKGGFDDLWMRLSSNEFSSTADYLFMHDIATIYNGKDLRTEVAKLAKATGASDGKVERFVHDWFGDSLGTSALYKMDANTKSLYRMMKYSPLSPISGTLMLIQSALLGTAMYLSKRRGLGFIMNMPEFNLLTLPKTETMKINGVEYNGLGWLQSLTREGDISLNSNTDLGRTFVDRMLDKLLGIVPMPAKMRETVQTVMKGGMQSIYDICAQDSIKQMALAQALATNGITSGYKFKQFLNALQNGKGSQELISNILGNAEINYSRFFSNSATTVMSRNRFSRRWMFNCMNNYTIIRSDEVIQGILKFRRDWGNGLLNDMSFGEYLLEYNPELKGLMNNMIMATKMGYHFNLMATGNTDNQENLEKYIVDSSDYLSSIPATFFYNILSAPFKGVSNYIDYTNAVGESETFGGAVKEATLQTLSATMSQFFREGKVINVFRDWLIAYAKTNNLDYANTVAGVDLEKIANGLGRFMLVEGTETYGVAALPERGDPIGQILLNSFETNQYGKAKTKLNNIVTAEEYLNGETSDNIVNILAYMPVFGEFIKNATTGQGFTFTQAKYNELEKMVDNDQVIKDLYKGVFDADQYSDASINRLYQDLIKFDYTANRTLGKDGEYKLGSYDAKTGSDTTLNDMKEAVFTKNMLDELGLTREEFVAKLNKADEGDKKALIKILAMADAAEPGSSRVCLSYLANKYHYELMKNYSGKDYPGGNDLTEEQTNEINRKVVEKYYPDMFVVDKTSWYKAVREYISLANPTVFDTLYKDEDLSGYVNSLGYLDMLMFQFAHEGDVDARYIKNAFSLIGKYVPNTEARVSIMNHTMQTIEDLDTYDSIKTMMKMGVIAGNTDIYDKIKKDELMNIMNPDLLETYENFVWGVDEEINQKGTALAIKELSDKEKKQYKGTYGKKFKYSKYSNGNNQTQDDVQKQAANMFPATQPHRAGNSIKHVKYTPTSFTPTRHSPLYFYIKIYEDTIKETSDKLVTTTGKKYPAQTIEGMTYHGTGSNRGRITARKLEFPERRRRTKNYSTDRWAGYPGG